MTNHNLNRTNNITTSLQSSNNKKLFFLKLGLYISTQSSITSRVYNLRGNLLGFRSKGRVALLNPLKNLIPLYKILIFLKDIVKFNGSVLLISDFGCSSLALQKYLKTIPNFFSLDVASIIPGFIANIKWVSWFMLMNGYGTILNKPDVIFFLNNDLNGYIYLTEAINSGVPLLTFSDLTRPQQTATVDFSISATHNLCLNNTLIILNLVIQHMAQARLVKFFKNINTRRARRPRFRYSKNYLLNYLPKLGNIAQDVVNDRSLSVSDIVSKYKKTHFNLIKLNLNTDGHSYLNSNLINTFYGFKVVTQTLNNKLNLKRQRGLSLKTFALFFKQWKVRIWDKRKRKLNLRKKWRFIFKYRRFFCKKFSSKLKLNYYRTLLLKKIFSNYFEFRYNFKTWWKETKASYLLNRLTNNTKNNGSNIFHKFLDKFERQLGFVSRKLGFIPNMHIFQTTVAKWRRVFVNYIPAKTSTYIIPNNSVMQKVFFSAYIPVDIDITSLRSLSLIYSTFLKKFLFTKSRLKNVAMREKAQLSKGARLRKIKLDLKLVLRNIRARKRLFRVLRCDRKKDFIKNTDKFKNFIKNINRRFKRIRLRVLKTRLGVFTKAL